MSAQVDHVVRVYAGRRAHGSPAAHVVSYVVGSWERGRRSTVAVALRHATWAATDHESLPGLVTGLYTCGERVVSEWTVAVEIIVSCAGSGRQRVARGAHLVQVERCGSRTVARLITAEGGDK